MNIPYNIKEAMNVLVKNNFEAYLVGGCVRDSLMDKTPHDYDITTNATPNEMLEIFKEYKIIETGLKHGTVTVIINNENIEITTYRIDGKYIDNRRPSTVDFTKKLDEDLSRRDFTVNALAMDSDGNLVDLFNGSKDIENKLIKCVGNPDKRFNEDALRILRALRFASVLGFEIDKVTSKSIHKNKHLLHNISVERIFSEFKKILCGINVENVLLEYRDVIAEFIPEIKPCFDFEQNNPHHIYDVYTHIVKSVSAVPSKPELRLSMFFHDIGKPSVYELDKSGMGHFKKHAVISSEIAKTVLKRLKSDKLTINTVETLVLNHDREIAETKSAVKRVISKLTYPIFLSLIDVKKADAFAHKTQEKDYDKILLIAKEIIEENECFSLKDLAINGYDLIEMGFNGVIIGKILDEILEFVTEEKISNNKTDILNFVNSKYKKNFV